VTRLQFNLLLTCIGFVISLITLALAARRLKTNRSKSQVAGVVTLAVVSVLWMIVILLRIFTL
jgi:uncharacterized membrane protein